MLVDKCGELKTIHRLFWTERFSKVDKGQQTAPDSMGYKQRRQKCAGLESCQGRPSPGRGFAGISRQPLNRRMFHQHGVRKLQVEAQLYLSQHPCYQQGMATEREEVLVQPDGVDLKQSLPDLLEPRFDWIEFLLLWCGTVSCCAETYRVQSLDIHLPTSGGGKGREWNELRRDHVMRQLPL